MKMKMRSIFFACWVFVLNLCLASSEKRSYEGYQVWSLYPENDQHYKFIHELELTTNEVIKRILF